MKPRRIEISRLGTAETPAIEGKTVETVQV
jgi:hypothetical protein